MSDAPWLRVRFAVHEQAPDELDSRPIKFPPPGPYWVSGQGQGPDDAYYDILIAFVPSVETLLEYWPDADLGWSGSDVQERAEITYSDRFPRPEWWSARTTPVTEADVARLRECDAEARKLLLDHMVSGPQWTDIRAAIKDGSIKLHSAPLSFFAESAVAAIMAALNTRPLDQLEAKAASVGWEGIERHEENITAAAKRMVAIQGMDWATLDGGDIGYWESLAAAALPTPPEDTDKSGDVT